MILDLQGCTKCTFFHHSGKSFSQIDYILTKPGCTLSNSVVIYDMHDINTSSHVPVTMSTTQYLSVTSNKRHHKSVTVVKKLKWDKIDKDRFQANLINSLNSEKFESVSIDEKVELLTDVLRRAASKSVPSVAHKLKGPQRRVSLRVRELLKVCKDAHKSWKYRQDDSNVDTLFAERKLAKKALRTQIRFEKSQEKENMISELMSNPSSKLFHRIVRRNRSDNTSTGTQYIKYNGKELYEPSEQIVAFKDFYEDLAMPNNTVPEGGSVNMRGPEKIVP